MTHAAAKGGVLIVDDDESVRESLADLVELAGCAPLYAANGAEALLVLARERPCMIILDLRMPVMNGEEFLKAMRSDPAWDDISVVISTSALHAPSDLPRIPKPIDVARALEVIRRACQCAASAQAS
jgi:CheY-like chemotaxis protein